MAMPSVGDIVLYGIGAPGGNVSFIDERGAHAGPSEDEMQTFILHSPSVALPAHPAQLSPRPGHGSARNDTDREARNCVSP
jgi:hypothetical protein